MNATPAGREDDSRVWACSGIRALTVNRSDHNNVVMSGEPKPAAVGAAEFKARCLELIDHVKETRAEYVVTRHGTPVARLVPVEPQAPVSPIGAMRGTVLAYDGPFDPVPATWSLSRDGETQDK